VEYGHAALLNLETTLNRCRVQWGPPRARRGRNGILGVRCDSWPAARYHAGAWQA